MAQNREFAIPRIKSRVSFDDILRVTTQRDATKIVPNTNGNP